MLSSPAGVQGRDGCHSLDVEGAHRPREEYSLELDGPRTGGCCPALPRESCKNSESQQTAQGQDAEVSCTWNEASLPATSKICLFPMQGQGAASEQKNASGIVPGNTMTCQEECFTLAPAFKKYLVTAQGKE